MKYSGEGEGKGRSFPVDPNLPRWLCQNCHNSLAIVGPDSYTDEYLNYPSSCSGMHGPSMHGANSVLGSTRMDNSFVVLPKQRAQVQGVPPRAHDASLQSDASPSGKAIDESFVVVYENESASDGGAGQLPLTEGDHAALPLPPNNSGFNTTVTVLKRAFKIATTPFQRAQVHGVPPHAHGASLQSDASSSGKAMDESFVVVYKNESASDGGTGQLPLSEGGHAAVPLLPNNSGFNTTITVLEHAFKIATTQPQVEQPLCLECMRILSDKLDKEVEDVNRDIEAYEACLQKSEDEARDILSEADFLKEKLKIEEEERKLEVAIQEIDKQYMEVSGELKELETKSSRFQELEERYWHEFNNFQFQLTSHQEERDAILAKIEVSQEHQKLLKRTSVLNDAFPIWHDGEFGRINNFRLGRLPKIYVEWDEINAAWGQACLLLHTMCQHFQPKFLYRIKILPMGSYPRIMDLSNNSYELFGPVDLFWSTRYDKAMTLFLTCLKDFAEFAISKDQDNNIPLEKCFKLPYKIENDKVENYSITQSFNKQENWTKTLKYTLCNLKWALYWFIGNTNFQSLSATESQDADVPAAGALYARRGTDAKFGSQNL